MNKFCATAVLSTLLAAPAAAEPFTPASYIKTVLDASLSLSQAEQTFKQSEDAYRVSLLDAVLPYFTFSMGDSFYDDNRHYLRVNGGDAYSRLSASLNLYDSASSPVSKINIAKLDYKRAQLAFLIAKQAEAIDALGKFYALYSTQQKILIAKTNLESRERQYKDTNEQFESGTRSKIEVTQSEGDKLQSELSLAQAEAAASKALMAFNELINAEPEAPQQVLISTQSVNVKLPLPREDVARALENNFSLSLQKTSLERTRLAERNSVMALYPRLKVDSSWAKADLGLLGTRGGAWQAGQTYGVGATLNFPFGFFGAQNYFGVKGQEAGLKSSELDLRNSVRALKTQVLTAQKDIELQVKSRQLLDFQVAAQKDATDNLLTEYSLGGASFLQLDSSQTKLLDASNSQITAINDLDLALANYRVLLGEKIWE
jgi:outer membrane protein TolC